MVLLKAIVGYSCFFVFCFFLFRSTSGDPEVTRRRSNASITNTFFVVVQKLHKEKKDVVPFSGWKNDCSVQLDLLVRSVCSVHLRGGKCTEQLQSVLLL